MRNRNVCSSTGLLATTLLAATSAATAATISVPFTFTFTNGTVADADEVDELAGFDFHAFFHKDFDDNPRHRRVQELCAAAWRGFALGPFEGIDRLDTMRPTTEVYEVDVSPACRKNRLAMAVQFEDELAVVLGRTERGAYAVAVDRKSEPLVAVRRVYDAGVICEFEIVSHSLVLSSATRPSTRRARERHRRVP